MKVSTADGLTGTVDTIGEMPITNDGEGVVVVSTAADEVGLAVTVGVGDEPLEGVLEGDSDLLELLEVVGVLLELRDVEGVRDFVANRRPFPAGTSNDSPTTISLALDADKSPTPILNSTSLHSS